MGLRQQIIQLLEQAGKRMTMQEIYTRFPHIAKSTVRGRVYNAMGSGVERVGKGLYISSKAIVEHGNSLEIIERMIDEGDLFDFIFLDISYAAGGQRGGNRNLFDCDKITPEQFATFMDRCKLLLRTDNSPLIFMFTSGRSSKPAHDAYITAVPLKRCSVHGMYTKLWSNGNRMNMGKYPMPEEHIYVFSRSGNLDLDIPDINFALTPDLKEYPTAKPYPMIRKLVEVFTQVGDWVLDPFGGSGKVLKACIELRRFCHTIDSSETSVVKHMIPLMV